MAEPECILWLDDDSPNVSSFLARGLTVMPTQTCEEADSTLVSRPGIRAAIIDPVVPQGKWMKDDLFDHAGIEFARRLKARRHDQITVVIWGAAMTGYKRFKAEQAGADLVLGKGEHSLADALGQLARELGLAGVVKQDRSGEQASNEEPS